MALIQRFTRLFKADLHGVLDRLEEPEILLRQALREMEEELESAGQAIKRLSRERDAVALRQQELSSSRAGAEQELDLCFEAQNEPLARKLLRRRLEADKLSQHLARKQEELERELRERQAHLEQSRSHYDSVRQKADLLTEEDQVSSTLEDGDTLWRSRDFSVREEEVDIALLKERQRRAEHRSDTP